MKTDRVVLEAPRALRRCPGCGGRRFAAKVEVRDGAETCVAMACAACGLDILEVYRWLKRAGRRSMRLPLPD
jgi:hypothetical protein